MLRISQEFGVMALDADLEIGWKKNILSIREVLVVSTFGDLAEKTHHLTLG